MKQSMRVDEQRQAQCARSRPIGRLRTTRRHAKAVRRLAQPALGHYPAQRQASDWTAAQDSAPCPGKRSDDATVRSDGCRTVACAQRQAQGWRGPPADITQCKHKRNGWRSRPIGRLHGTPHRANREVSATLRIAPMGYGGNTPSAATMTNRPSRTLQQPLCGSGALSMIQSMKQSMRVDESR